MSIFIDFHVLQTVPPSCVNRDDTGSPKTAVYGGVTRARISSQCWKHAVREDFKYLFEENQLGSRTKYVVDMVVNEMVRISENEAERGTYEKQAKTVLTNAGISLDSKKGQAKALFFISHAEATALAKLALEGVKDKAACKEALRANPSIDIALFGRMAASDPELNCDAASQVAHAISTHEVHNEYDYFTAVDDCQKDDNAGAGHLGTTEFNSSTLYRYACINATELTRTLGGGVADVVSKFAKAFICSMPTGKQNSFANRTFPDYVYITIRNDQPVNLVGAFEKPIRHAQEGYVGASIKALSDYRKKVYENYAAAPLYEFGIGSDGSDAEQTGSLPEVLEKLEESLRGQLHE